MDVLNLGIILVSAGAACWLVIALLVKVVPILRRMPVTSQKSPAHNNAILIVRIGGRVLFGNEQARIFFRLRPGEAFNLERMAKHIQPSERFLALCAEDGQEHLALDHEIVEFTSYQVSIFDHSVRVLTLHQTDQIPGLPSTQTGISAQTLQELSEVFQTVPANLDPETTLQSFLVKIEKLIPADFIEIVLYKVEEEALIPYHLLGKKGEEREVKQSSERYRLGEGICGYIAKERKPLFIADISTRADLQPEFDQHTYPLASYIGVPLLVGKDLVGTLDMGSFKVNAFRQDDLDLLQLLAGLMATLIQSTVLFGDGKKERERLSEMVAEYQQQLDVMQTRLAAMDDEKSHVQQMAETSHKSMPVLLQKELEQTQTILSLSRQLNLVRTRLEMAELTNQQGEITLALHTLATEMINRFDMQTALIAECSFGVVRLIEIIGKVTPETNSGTHFGQRNPLRQALEDGQVRIVSDLKFDTEWKDNLLLKALKARSFISLPLTISKERVAGILCVGKKAHPGFEEDDRQMFNQLASQVSIGMQNWELLDDTQRHLRDVKILLDFSRSLGNLDPSNILSSLLKSVLHAFPGVEAGWVGLADADREQLVPIQAKGYANIENLLKIRYSIKRDDKKNHKSTPLPVRVFLSGVEQRLNEIDFAVEYPFGLDDLMNYKKGTGGNLPISSMCVPLQLAGHNMGVLVLENFINPAAFSEEDQSLLLSFGQLTAMALENARLYEESQLRADELEMRSQRLSLLNRSAGELGSSLDIGTILQRMAQQLYEAFDVVHVAVITLDEMNRYILRAEAPSINEELPMPLYETKLFESIIEDSGMLHVTENFNEAELDPLLKAFFEPHQLKSRLIVPLSRGSKVLGWLLLQGHEGYQFATAEIDLTNTISHQATIAIQNAQLYEETCLLKEDLEKRVEERTLELKQQHSNSQSLLQIIIELSASPNAFLVVNNVLGILNRAVGTDQSMIFLIDTKSKIYQAGESLATISRSEKLWVAPERELSRYVIRNRKHICINDVSAEQRWFESESDLPPAYQSLMVLPIMQGEDAVGALLLFSKQPDFFKDYPLNFLEAVARQFGIAINNAALFNLARDQADSLSIMLRNQQTILEAIVDGVVVTDAEKRIALFNASAERILGFAAIDVIGRPLEQFAGVVGETGRIWIKTIDDWSTDTMLRYDSEQTYSVQLKLSNGRIVSVHLAPVIWGMEFLGTVSIFRDITHEVQVDQLKSEFVANVSHELRTPITSIKGYIEVLLMGASGKINSQQKQFLEVARSNIDRLTILVNELLDISRIEAGKTALNFERLDLRQIAENVADTFRQRSAQEGKALTIELEAEPGLPPVRGDALRVRQILSNLVSNSYTYTTDDGHITINLRIKENTVQVDVKDDGIGIKEEHQHRIFERFYRGEDPLVLASAGTGLGLALSKSMIEMQDGEIWFSSSGVNGEGCIFSFTLPIYQDNNFIKA